MKAQARNLGAERGSSLEYGCLLAKEQGAPAPALLGVTDNLDKPPLPYAPGLSLEHR